MRLNFTTEAQGVFTKIKEVFALIPSAKFFFYPQR